MELASQILSDITVHTKYAKHVPHKKRRETWYEIVSRNKEMHLKKYPHIKEEIEDAYKLVYDKKILPSMRSLQFGGRPVELSPNRLYNCAYLPADDPKAFSEIMFLLLGGSGVGYSVQKHHVSKLPEIRKPNPNKKRRFLIGDDIRGWADTIKALMKSYFEGKETLVFDFSDIRKKGEPLKTSGGRAPGPEPLKKCVRNIKSILNEKESGESLRPIEVHDIICHIADAVLAGGIRRAALISLFSADDEEMISCKYGTWYESNPQRGRSNNSAVLLRHKVTEEFFQDLWKKIELSNSGEPGVYFTNDKEWGTNPCCEIALRPFQFCNLVEVNASNIESQEDLNARAKAAAFIATLQAGYTEFHYLRPIWQKTTEKDALIGVGMTGIGSGKVLQHSTREAAKIVKAENARVAELIGINKAARTTCIKPSGTSSMVLGSSSGIHAWHNEFYERRMEILKDDPLYLYLARKHPELVEDHLLQFNTACIVIPQKAPEGAILRKETALQSLERVKKFSINWVKPGHVDGHNTHNISATIYVKPNEWERVGRWMWENRDYYNGLAVLPHDGGSYSQAPFTDCTEEDYNDRMQHLVKVDLTKVVEEEDNTELSAELACAGGKCEI